MCANDDPCQHRYQACDPTCPMETSDKQRFLQRQREKIHLLSCVVSRILRPYTGHTAPHDSEVSLKHKFHDGFDARATFSLGHGLTLRGQINVPAPTNYCVNIFQPSGT